MTTCVALFTIQADCKLKTKQNKTQIGNKQKNITTKRIDANALQSLKELPKQNRNASKK